MDPIPRPCCLSPVPEALLHLLPIICDWNSAALQWTMHHKLLFFFARLKSPSARQQILVTSFSQTAKLSKSVPPDTKLIRKSNSSAWLKSHLWHFAIGNKGVYYKVIVCCIGNVSINTLVFVHLLVHLFIYQLILWCSDSNRSVLVVIQICKPTKI